MQFVYNDDTLGNDDRSIMLKACSKHLGVSAAIFYRRRRADIMSKSKIMRRVIFQNLLEYYTLYSRG